MRKQHIWIRLSLSAVCVLLPALNRVAAGQQHDVSDIANRVLRGPKAARRSGIDPALPQDTDEVLVQVRPGTDVHSLAFRHGMAAVRRLNANGWFVLKASEVRGAKAAAAALRSDSDIVVAGNNQRTAYQKFGFYPNDPYFLANNPTIGWPGQWHLQNNIGGTIDSDVVPAWAKGWTGSGVVIGVLDDCLQKSHPDLSPNFSSSNSWDFGQGDADPSPVNGTDMHGTSVAGVAAARGGNGIGGSGAAPQAKLAGLRVDFAAQTSQQFVDATLFHTSNGNETIKIENHSYGYTAPFIATPLEKQALATSAADQTIHVFAAGNERGNRAQDSNTLDLQSSSDAITVAALGEDGKFASYSSFGSNVFVCAPSSSSNLPGILTTDVVGGNGYNPGFDTFPNQDYTSVFGGTSSAAPLVSGVLALAKQANPFLTLRLAKHLLARSCNVVDPADATPAGGWITNAAGFKFNENYGFGCIDADKLVTNALMYLSVTKAESEQVGPVTDGQTIPDNNTTGIFHDFNIASQTPLEDVVLHVDITHTYRGDLEIWLRSPAGTWSRLKSTALGGTANTSDSGSNIHWTFTSNAFWGETPTGTWQVLVKDLAGGDIGTFDGFTFTAHMGLPVLQDNAHVTNTAVPTAMIAGQSYDASVVFQNNGFSTWTSPLWYLRSENPSANTTWGFRTLKLGQFDAIGPGNSKTFAMKLIAPMDGGVYDFQWRMRHSGYTSFGEWPDVLVNVTVAGDAARMMSASVPASVTAGSTFPVTITMRNVGTNAWAGGSTYHLKAVTTTTKWGNPTVPLTLGDFIDRGQDKVFTISAVAPATPGKYVMQWRMENGNVAFGDLSPGYKIIVAAP